MSKLPTKMTTKTSSTLFVGTFSLKTYFPRRKTQINEGTENGKFLIFTFFKNSSAGTLLEANSTLDSIKIGPKRFFPGFKPSRDWSSCFRPLAGDEGRKEDPELCTRWRPAGAFESLERSLREGMEGERERE
jgi:hypothetical protein